MLWPFINIKPYKFKFISYYGNNFTMLKPLLLLADTCHAFYTSSYKNELYGYRHLIDLAHIQHADGNWISNIKPALQARRIRHNRAQAIPPSCLPAISAWTVMTLK